MAKKEEKKAPTVVAPNPRRVKAITKYLRIAPRKVRVVLGTIKKRPVMEAMGVLSLLNKKGAVMALKTLKSAVANAKNLGLDEKRLIVADVRADGGPVLKRFLTRSMGRADRLLKRTTHLTVVVCEGTKFWGGTMPEDAKAKQKKKAASAA
ncbi:MAG TPA: 50S ribosomal protein L22 [Candidatus Omnitrophota bacterium]|nr:50S ribosomal protein L22 [Candidatus Omnitrophota bacterium]HPS36185.1 50S ribosomal protein L22 [Candidatus Omnitrophota bacterium]